MAETAPLVSVQSSTVQPSKMKTVKALADSPGFCSIPAAYIVTPSPNDRVSSGPASNIPVIDYSLLVSANPDQRSKTIDELVKACQDWGFFMVINHGVPEKLMASMIDACREFFDQPVEMKQEYEGKHVMDPIRCGTSFNTSVEKLFFWKDFLKLFVHPVFHSPSKPAGFRETALEYSKRARELARELLKGISQGLGQEANFIYKRMHLEQGLQVMAANFYPPCPQPELTLGMPPHSDHGLLTVLITDGTSGLQIQHEGKWFDVINTIPNSILVNVGDNLEMLSNGRYKSVVHRVLVSNKAARISTAIANGPSLDAVVGPAPELLQAGENNAPAYMSIIYKDYLNLNQSNQLDRKSSLDRVRI